VPGGRQRTRIFLDYHAFAHGWAAQAGGGLTDWGALPAVLVDAAQAALAAIDATPLALTETVLYAAVDRQNVGQRWWLEMTLGGQPGWRVAVRDTTVLSSPTGCPACGDLGLLRPPKIPLTEMTSHLVALAHKNAFDVAVVVSDAAELVPAVEGVQELGLRVVNAGWLGAGGELRAACWAGLDLDALIEPLSR
jgi:NYN domain